MVELRGHGALLPFFLGSWDCPFWSCLTHVFYPWSTAPMLEALELGGRRMSEKGCAADGLWGFQADRRRSVWERFGISSTSQCMTGWLWGLISNLEERKPCIGCSSLNRLFLNTHVILCVCSILIGMMMARLLLQWYADMISFYRPYILYYVITVHTLHCKHIPTSNQRRSVRDLMLWYAMTILACPGWLTMVGVSKRQTMTNGHEPHHKSHEYLLLIAIICCINCSDVRHHEGNRDTSGPPGFSMATQPAMDWSCLRLFLPPRVLKETGNDKHMRNFKEVTRNKW